MNEQQFSILIETSPAVVWQSLWEGDNYREWAAVFAPGSEAVTDWKQGSKVLFLDGNGSGMVSSIATLKKNEVMGFRHHGLVKDGVEIVDTPEATDWQGDEIYRLKQESGGTRLTVETSFRKLTPEFAAYFAATFPRALEKVKEISERKVSAVSAE